MPTPEHSAIIPAALSQFQTLPLKDAARQLLAKLGYKSDKFLVGAGSKPQDFLADFATSQPFDQAKALVSEWKSADLLFQLTDAELSRTASLFKETDVRQSFLQSYVFIAIELKGTDYARGKFSAIARQINRLFPMPVMVIFKHGDRLTIAVINRRKNKTDESKDVLEKATLIRDITFAQPHRGHLDILGSLALPNLVHPKKLPIQDFDTLHAAWEQIFNVELLNERFYRELANWYFWALPQVEFPADLEPDREKRNATGLIRLLTRLIFCWFLKEKGLIPEKLFHPTDLAKLLKGFDPESETSSTYYQAILQNLFFATLNQRMGKDGNGKPYRVFATDEGFVKNRATYDVNNLYRYEGLFADAPDVALEHFADVPFLNGGLFECLDRTEESGTDIPVCDSGKTVFKKRYLDGFSRNPKKRPHIPDRLFFDSGETADLSTTYGDKKRKAERVTGLITILNRYKFTIVENTPIDQEIALDPELLGKVFENLLASYNEETKTTARKQTGSFYTPRPIVDYMVDESLKAHLERKVAETILSRSANSLPRSSGSDPDKIVGVTLQATLQPYNPEAPTSKTRHNLPHWTQNGTTYWVTFRLADSLPQDKLKTWTAERDTWASHHPEPWSDADWKEYNERFGERLQAWLDAGTGECHLRRPELRSLVEKCLLHFDGIRYDLGPWVIMPNHVHLLIRPHEGQSLSKILQGIKGVSAKECNALLDRAGQTFWQQESFDHIVRSQIQFDRFVRYIAENPVSAHLANGEFSQSNPDNPVGVVGATPIGEPHANPHSNPETGLSRLRSRLDQLFTYTEEPHQFNPIEVACLIAAIDALKILDPACGSGAFPMGVLHKLVYILGKLDPDNDRWKQTQLAKLDSAPMREELERTFADNNDDYGRKLYLIENCLYGVDIQPIAIQITKLRFFISLVCDQKTNRNKKENHGIRPLPNLETKFVAADTLIGLPISDKDLFIESLIAPIEKEIEDAYHGHFTIQRRDQKLALQKRIKALRLKLAETLAGSLGAVNSAKAKHLAEWDPFDPQSTADFFDPHWMFGRSLKDGFDIVIGNPPYIQIQKFPSAQKAKWEAQKFATYTATADIYCLFYERGAKFLRANGHLCYITSNKWMRAGYGEQLRNFLASKVNTSAVLDFGMAQNFGAATTYTCVTSLAKQSSAHRTLSCYASDTAAAMSEPADYFARNAVPLTALNGSPWVILPPDRQAIKNQVEAQGIPLANWDIAIYRGVLTGFNDAFYLTQQQRDAFVAEDPHCAKFLVPLLRGRFVGRYGTNWDGTWMIATFPVLNLEFQNLPSPIQRHLQEFKFRLEPKPKDWKGGQWNGRKAGAYKWFETQDVIGYHQEFTKPKIIYQEIAVSLPFFYDQSCRMFMDTTCFMISSATESLPFLTAVLNSTIFRCCFRDNFPEYSGNASRVKKIFMDKIPIKKPTAAEASLFERLVPLVQFAKSGADNPVCDSSSQATDRIVCATFLEDLIDACVMECYFREHMAERDLLFHDTMAPHLATYAPKASAAQQRDFLNHLHKTLNAPSHPIRKRLLRLTSDSPDLLAVIKAEGRV